MPELNEAQERADFGVWLRSHTWPLSGHPIVEQYFVVWKAARRASSAQQVEAVSTIDSGKFRALAYTFALRFSKNQEHGEKALSTLIAHIDTKLPQAATGSADGLDAKHYRGAIADVCEGWNISPDLRKFLETALWNPPSAQQGADKP